MQASPRQRLKRVAYCVIGIGTGLWNMSRRRSAALRSDLSPHMGFKFGTGGAEDATGTTQTSISAGIVSYVFWSSWVFQSIAALVLSIGFCELRFGRWVGDDSVILSGDSLR